MKLHHFILSGLFILMLGACSTAKLNPSIILVGQPWVLSSFAGENVDLSKFTGGIPTLNFLEGGRLAGFAGCNNFSGEFAIEGSDTLTLEPGAMTKKACPGSGESEFLTAFGNVKNFTLEKEKLTLMDGTTELMSFTPNKD
jgi:heat shock protein HslJ